MQTGEITVTYPPGLLRAVRWRYRLCSAAKACGCKRLYAALMTSAHQIEDGY
ncbi:MAG TPA: hypothetical protein VGG75_13625 [Trebonia sp.]|jgi:hypothetical protein